MYMAEFDRIAGSFTMTIPGFFGRLIGLIGL
jgi:hypothetical protein